MSDSRRYDDDEVAEILERAASETALAPGSPGMAHGLTLPELQEIGAQVGISPERIADAARSLAVRDLAGPTRTLLGAPRSVAHIVHIERPLDDDEWARLVADLRATFRAMGRVRTEGPLRSWRNGNLQVHVEPDVDGYRVRMSTVKGDAGSLALVGVGSVGMGGLILFGGMFGGGFADDTMTGIVLAGGGAGLIAYARVMLPAWAAERKAQMLTLADRIPRLLKGGG